MREQILQLPAQLPKGVELAKNIKTDKTYEKVIVCGMGGSIIPGEILIFWQEVSGMPPTFYVHRDYDLPAWVSKNDLVICISWSGNPEETLSCYEAAVKMGVPVVSITTGGKLAELSSKYRTPLVLLPNKNVSPRMGTGYMTAALFQLVGLGEKVATILLDAIKTEAEGNKLADKIDKAIPLFYSSYKWRIVPHLWKILFNENDKIHAFWNYFPAMAHNELAGFTKKQEAPNNFYPIFFKDADDERQNKNIDTTIAILNEIGYNYSIVDISPSKKPLEVVFNSYILGFWTSYYLAKILGVDPEDTRLIEKFKDAKKQL